MSSLKKWKLLKKTDVSPSPWFAIERREYELPSGKIIDDFYVTTVADVSMIIPVTKDKKLILARQYKPGVDEITLEFPAGRIESHHSNFFELAQHELEEEVGIHTENLEEFAVVAGFVTKGTERVHLFLARDVEFNSQQHFDVTEQIEIVQFSVTEFEDAIQDGKVLGAQTIAAWYLVKRKFPEIFS